MSNRLRTLHSRDGEVANSKQCKHHPRVAPHHLAADRGKRLLQLARFDPGAGDIPALNAAEVRKCTRRASRPDGSCVYWSVVNALPSFGSKSDAAKMLEIARVKGVVSEEIADLVFGSDHENRREDTLSHVEGHLLVTHVTFKHRGRNGSSTGTTFLCRPRAGGVTE